MPLRADLCLPEELRGAVEVVKTSPFDTLELPVGQFTAERFALLPLSAG